MATPDRDLLLGLLALQNGLIDQGTLVAAFQAWTRDKARPTVASPRRAYRFTWGSSSSSTTSGLAAGRSSEP